MPIKKIIFIKSEYIKLSDLNIVVIPCHLINEYQTMFIKVNIYLLYLYINYKTFQRMVHEKVVSNTKRRATYIQSNLLLLYCKISTLIWFLILIEK